MRRNEQIQDTLTHAWDALKHPVMSDSPPLKKDKLNLSSVLLLRAPFLSLRKNTNVKKCYHKIGLELNLRFLLQQQPLN